MSEEEEQIMPKDREKILELFKRYEFKDKQGHPLHNCIEFLELVESFCASEDRKCVKK